MRYRCDITREGSKKRKRIYISWILIPRSRSPLSLPLDGPSVFPHHLDPPALLPDRLPTFQPFFFPAAAAAAFPFAVFFRWLWIMTMLRKLPTTATPNRMRITGMRIAQTRGGKRSCSGWPGSTKGYNFQQICLALIRIWGRKERLSITKWQNHWTDHEEGPCCVVEENGGGDYEHC